MTEQSGGHSSLSERSLRSPSPAETATTPFEANMVDVEGGPALQLVHPATLADALELARLNGSLPIDKLVQIASAIRVVEKATGLAADKLPSAPEYLTPIIQHAFPARHRIWPKRWQNALSMVRKLLRACDLLAPRVTGLPSSPAWAALIGALPENRERASDARFRALVFRAGIRPEDVTGADLDVLRRFSPNANYPHLRRPTRLDHPNNLEPRRASATARLALAPADSPTASERRSSATGLLPAIFSGRARDIPVKSHGTGRFRFRPSAMAAGHRERGAALSDSCREFGRSTTGWPRARQVYGGHSFG